MDSLKHRSTDERHCGDKAAKDVLDHTSGESHYDTAKDFYDFIEDEVGKGRDREKCLMHCMRAYALEQDPRKTPWSDDTAPSAVTDIEEAGDDSISIGGIRLDVHQENEAPE
jgi:hypothetical protein